jgi:hypothetical protein
MPSGTLYPVAQVLTDILGNISPPSLGFLRVIGVHICVTTKSLLISLFFDHNVQFLFVEIVSSATEFLYYLMIMILLSITSVNLFIQIHKQINVLGPAKLYPLGNSLCIALKILGTKYVYEDFCETTY